MPIVSARGPGVRQMTISGRKSECTYQNRIAVPVMLVVHQCWIDGYKDFNFMRASAVVKRQSTFMAS